MKPTIVIVNYNGGNYLIQAIRSVIYTKALEKANLVVVDNGSGDASLEYLKTGFWKERGIKDKYAPHTCEGRYGYGPKEVVLSCKCKVRTPDDDLIPGEMNQTVVLNETIFSRPVDDEWGRPVCSFEFLNENYGYERGANFGALVSGMLWPNSDLILMGSDAELLQGTLDGFNRTLELHPKIGIVCGKLLVKVGDRYLVNAGGFTNEMGHEHITGMDEAPGTWHDFKEQEWVTFSCTYIKRELFETAGHMDMTFHIYCGDNDLCRRARQLGWAVVYSPISAALHYDGRTVSKVKKRTLPSVWGAWQTHEMGYFSHKWQNEIVPFPILPEDVFKEANTWAGR